MLAPTERCYYAVAFVSAIELSNTSERLKSEPIEATDARARAEPELEHCCHLSRHYFRYYLINFHPSKQLSLLRSYVRFRFRRLITLPPSRARSDRRMTALALSATHFIFGTRAPTYLLSMLTLSHRSACLSEFVSIF